MTEAPARVYVVYSWDWPESWGIDSVHASLDAAIETAKSGKEERSERCWAVQSWPTDGSRDAEVEWIDMDTD